MNTKTQNNYASLENKKIKLWLKQQWKFLKIDVLTDIHKILLFMCEKVYPIIILMRLIAAVAKKLMALEIQFLAPLWLTWTILQITNTKHISITPTFIACKINRSIMQCFWLKVLGTKWKLFKNYLLRFSF